jgi:antitoxin VapB
MQLSIKKRETYILARNLAARTGESLTEAVIKALQERLERLEATDRQTAATKSGRLRRIGETLERFDALPVFDERGADEIIDYDEDGLPR